MAVNLTSHMIILKCQNVINVMQVFYIRVNNQGFVIYDVCDNRGPVNIVNMV